MGRDTPAVSIVIPAKNEAAFLPRTLDSLAALSEGPSHEIVVVDGQSRDRTAAIARERGISVVEGTGQGIGLARNRGAAATDGTWLAFVDADTQVQPNWLASMWEFVQEHGLKAASSRCHMPGVRARLMEWTINHLFSRLPRPILPGFNFWIERSTFEQYGGFPEVPNEDTALSRRLGAAVPVGVHPDRLVTHSSRRIRQSGLTGTAYHYARLDLARLRGADPGRDPGRPDAD